MYNHIEVNMKRKFFIILIVLITMVFTLSACAQNDAGPRYEQDVQEDTGYDIIINKSNRKIIYTFRIEMTTKNLNDTVERITKLVKKNPKTRTGYRIQNTIKAALTDTQTLLSE